MKLQEYLNEEYPTKEEKEKVKEIDIRKINEKEKGLQFYKFLDGGELDLREFKNIERILIKLLYLLTPLTKLNVSDCNKLEDVEC